MIHDRMQFVSIFIKWQNYKTLPAEILSLVIVDIFFLLEEFLQLVYLPAGEGGPGLLHLVSGVGGVLGLLGGELGGQGEVERGVGGEDVRDEVAGQVPAVHLELQHSEGQGTGG